MKFIHIEEFCKKYNISIATLRMAKYNKQIPISQFKMLAGKGRMYVNESYIIKRVKLYMIH